MGLPKKLTEQQIKFANLLISEQGRKECDTVRNRSWL
jgi:hypothetical protein